MKGGARLTDFTESGSGVTRKDRHYTVGAYGELRLPVGLSVEADFLYTRSAATIQIPLTSGSYTEHFSMDSYGLPVLLKKSFAPKEVVFRPFVEAGLACRYTTSIPGGQYGGIFGVPGMPPSILFISPPSDGWQHGFVMGGGAEFRLQKLRLSGELRWSRFGRYSSNYSPKLNANQAELLFGIGF